MVMKKIIGVRGINYYQFPKMGSNNLMFGIDKSSKNKKSSKKKRK